MKPPLTRIYSILLLFLLLSCDALEGPPGIDSLVEIADEAAGSNCATGGARVTIGADSNKNGVLDTDEIKSTKYICKGNTGNNSLIKTTTENAGANCDTGGLKVEVGADTNANGNLDQGEITATQFVCNGATGLHTLINSSVVAPGTDCTYGGVKLDTGVDIDGDGLLETDEVETVRYVCNGQPGSQGSLVTLNFNAAQSVGLYDATIKFTVQTNGDDVFDYGLVWGLAPSPTTDGPNKISMGTCHSTCQFNKSLSDLQSGTKYYYRAYLITGLGISYSEEYNFTTGEASWTQLDDFPGDGRMLGVAFSIGDKGYVGLGMGTGNVFLNDFWEFDSEDKTWTRKADFPGGVRIDAISFVVNGRGYVGTGLDGSSHSTSDLWEYNPALNEWTQKADYPGGNIEFAVGFAIGDKGYVGIGTRRNTSPSLVSEFYEYSPANNEWTQRADFPGEAADKRFSFPIDNKGYVGIGDLNLGGSSKQFWQYDPVGNEWTQKNQFGGNAGYYTTAFVVEGRGYTCSGRFGGTEVMVYDPTADQWRNAPEFLGSAREGLSSFVIGNAAYIGFGSGGADYKNDVWRLKILH